MVKAIKRLQLRRRGLSSARKRRTQDENEVLQILRFSPYIKAFIFFLFFLGLVALTRVNAEGNPIFGQDSLKASAISFFIFIAALVQFYANHPNSFAQNSRVLLVFGAILVQLSLIRVITLLVGNTPSIAGTALASNYVFLLIPYALSPMALSVLLGRRQAIFAVIFSAIFGCLLIDRDLLFEYLLAGFISGLVAVYATDELRKRSRLMHAGIYVGLTTMILAIVLGRISLSGFMNPSSLNWRLISTQVLTVLLVGVVTSGVVGGFLPMLESFFGVTTNISWLELADLNHPLLKRMTLEAPGTYHHSLMVARLAEAAAEQVGANAKQCQVCAYFHDIGKLVKPLYFIENQSCNGTGNPHDNLSPSMSALVVMAHVKEGVNLAIKHKLNSQVIDVIQEHHGNSLVYFFHRRALSKQEEQRRLVAEGQGYEDDVPDVDEKNFRYPGPLPQSKESAIISLADALESASRCLEKPTPGKIEQLVEDIFASRLKDGQLHECELTFRELSVIKQSFTKTLISMMHSRIAYPKDDETKTSEAKANITKFRVHDAA